MKVTGFHIVTMAHRFGLRARAMIQSICVQPRATEHGTTLTVFYADDADKSLIQEVKTARGNKVPDEHFVKVPLTGEGNDILYRAALFHSSASFGRHSHTIFADSDLWFPPKFFSDYAAALEAEKSGYWSAYVHNVMRPGVNELVKNDWRDLTVEKLEKHRQPMTKEFPYRYDDKKGRVGHFQCIPTGLLKYPCDQFKGMAFADFQFAEQAIALSEDKREERRIGPPIYHLDHSKAYHGAKEQL